LLSLPSFLSLLFYFALNEIRLFYLILLEILWGTLKVYFTELSHFSLYFYLFFLNFYLRQCLCFPFIYLWLDMIFFCLLFSFTLHCWIFFVRFFGHFFFGCSSKFISFWCYLKFIIFVLIECPTFTFSQMSLSDTCCVHVSYLSDYNSMILTCRSSLSLIHSIVR